MKKVEGMSLEELIELDKKMSILSIFEFKEERLKDIEDCDALITFYRNYRRTLPIYRELSNLYNIFLDRIIEEIENSPLDINGIILNMLVSNLLYKSYLSYTKKFHAIKFFYSEFDYFMGSHDLGMTIVAGYGVCRHVNSFAGNILGKKGIEYDKVPTVVIKEDSNRKTGSEECTHLLLGFKEDGKYTFVDPYSQIFKIHKIIGWRKNMYKTGENNILIPKFSDSTFYLFQDKKVWTPDLPYKNNTVDKLEKNMEEYMRLEGEKKFQKFKEKNHELYEKIAYLVGIEFFRTKEKEKKKIYK